MEQRPFEHEEEDDLDSESSNKKRTSTFSKYLSLLRRKETDRFSSAESEDDEEGEKPRRFRGLFRKLFPSIVEHPHQVADKAQPRQFDPESLFSWMRPTIETPDPAKAADELEHTPRIPAVESETAFAEQQPNTEGLNGDIHPERPAQTAREVEEPAPVAERSFTQEDQLIQPSVEQASDRMVYERTTQQPVEKEIVIERGPGMALPVVLVGAEYLARKKADRKLEKRVNERISTTNKEVDRSASLQRELENITRQNQEQIETLKRDRGIITSPEKRQQPERITPRAAEQAEKLPQPRPRATEQAVSLAAEKPDEPETYKILEQVAEAADHNVPVERVFERSHEVKDDQTVPVGAVSVGAIMATQAASHRLAQQAKTSSQPTDTSGLPVVYDSPAGNTYRQAMQRGFWAAVTIIIIGIIAYLLK